MTHDDGVRWLAAQLRERLEPLDADVRERYLAAVSSSEEEYWRGNRDAYDVVLGLLHELCPVRSVQPTP